VVQTGSVNTTAVRGGATSPQRGRWAAIGAVLLGTLGGVIWLWSALTGSAAIVRTIPLPTAHAAGSVMVNDRAGRAVIAGEGSVSVLDTHSGDLIRATMLGGSSFGAMTISTKTSRAFILGRRGGLTGPGDRVSVVDTRTGLVVRTVAIPFAPTAAAVDEWGGHVFIACEGGRKANGTSFRGTGTVVEIDARTGAPLRAIPALVHPVAVAIDARTRRVFVVNGGTIGRTGPGQGTVSVLDADTGRALYTAMVGVGAASIAVDERSGHVFVANEGGHTVSMLDARTGIVRKTIGVGYPTGLAVDTRGGHVLVADGSAGSVSVLDAANGAIVATVAVGGGPQAIAVDARTSRAFITATGVNTTIRLLHHLGAPWGDEDVGSYVTVLDTRDGRVVRVVRVAPTAGVAVDERAGHAFVTDWDKDSVSMLDARR